MKKAFKAVSKDLRMTRPPRMEGKVQNAGQRLVKKPKRK